MGRLPEVISKMIRNAQLKPGKKVAKPREIIPAANPIDRAKPAASRAERARRSSLRCGARDDRRAVDAARQRAVMACAATAQP